MARQRRRWVRVGFVYLALTFLEVGLWATFTPRSFYDDFPGLGRSWVAGDGPCNAHLASDAGVGFLAVGTVLVLAAVWMERRVMHVALLGAALHGLGHLFFHLSDPNGGLGSLDQVLSNGGLLLGVVVAVILTIAITRQPAPDHGPPARTGAGRPEIGCVGECREPGMRFAIARAVELDRRFCRPTAAQAEDAGRQYERVIERLSLGTADSSDRRSMPSSGRFRASARQPARR